MCIPSFVFWRSTEAGSQFGGGGGSGWGTVSTHGIICYPYCPAALSPHTCPAATGGQGEEISCLSMSQREGGSGREACVSACLRVCVCMHTCMGRVGTGWRQVPSGSGLGTAPHPWRHGGGMCAPLPAAPQSDTQTCIHRVPDLTHSHTHTESPVRLKVMDSAPRVGGAAGVFLCPTWCPHPPLPSP